MIPAALCAAGLCYHLDMNIRVIKFHSKAQMPTFSHDSAAGMDLYTPERFEIPAHTRVIAKTGIGMEIPNGYAGLIWSRSSVAAKYGVEVLAGVIDADYRGDIGVVLLNTTDKEYVFEAGDRIAQMLIQEVRHCTFSEVDELSDSARGDSAFGSTGR